MQRGRQQQHRAHRDKEDGHARIVFEMPYTGKQEATGNSTTAARNPSDVTRPKRIRSSRAQIAAAINTRLSNVP